MKSDYVKKTDLIQKAVADTALQNYRRKGRIFNKRSGDVISVVEFRVGRKYNDETFMLFVNMGLYFPQPSLHSFDGIIEPDKYYHEYECWLRTSIGQLQEIYSYKGFNDKFFDLNTESSEKITEEICKVLWEIYLPDVEKLNTVEKMLQNGKELAGELGKKRWWSNELDYIFLYAANGEMPTFVSEFQSYYNRAKLNRPQNVAYMDYLVNLSKMLNIDLVP